MSSNDNVAQKTGVNLFWDEKVTNKFSSLFIKIPPGIMFGKIIEQSISPHCCKIIFQVLKESHPGMDAHICTYL